MKLIPFLEVLTHKQDPFIKSEKYKERLQAREDLMRDDENNYIPVASCLETRFFLSIIAGLKLIWRQTDIYSAYMLD